MREVAIIGIGQTNFGKQPDIRGEQLAREAAGKALRDSGISPKSVQVAYTARLLNAMSECQKALMPFGISNIEMYNVQNACAGGSSAVHLLWKDIAYGIYDAGIAIGVEDMVYPKGSNLGVGGKALAAEEGDLEADMGQSMPAKFAMIARRMMEKYGATSEDFAQVAVKSHNNAALNPYAHFNKKVTAEEVLNSKMICDPITVYQCCPISDGAAAVVLCSMEMARKYTANPVKIIGSSFVTGDYTFRQKDINAQNMSAEAIKKAYEMAGVGPEDLDVIEIHDAFAPEEIIRYEDLGLCKRGEGTQLIRSGATALGGRIPVNPSGGLISLGHPLSASGVRVTVDIARQIRGEAGKAQVKGAKVGLAHMLGGVVTGLEGGACSIQIMTR